MDAAKRFVPKYLIGMASSAPAVSVRWVDPSYIAVYHVLTNPVYAGAYAYGKSRREIAVDAYGGVSLFVVAFVAFPVAAALFRQAEARIG
jgi:hypothetical protein